MEIVIEQLEAVVMELYNRNKKWPLVVLHNKRLRAFQGSPSNQKLLEEWLAQGTLYATPSGSNDDWWGLTHLFLFLVVSCHCFSNLTEHDLSYGVSQWNFHYTEYVFRYWLYAAVKFKCLLVTNDEMRDHIFELLGSSFFLQWKERHQVCTLLFSDSLCSVT